MKGHSRCVSTWLQSFALLVWVTPAFAVDGVLEINQTCAVETGCFATDIPGYPVTIGESGSYRLTSALAVPLDGTGVEITAEDVTLDLNGFSIRAPSDCTAAACPGLSGRGVTSSAAGTRISNGFIRGFADGGVDLGDESVVERVEARANGRVGISVGDRGRIANSQSTNGAGDGFQVGDHGAVLGSVAVGNQQIGAVLGVATGIGDAVVSDNGSFDVTGGAPFGSTSCSGAACSTICTDVDEDGAFSDCVPADCDDGEPASFPGNSEICDSIDNDCDGAVDEGLTCTFSVAACKLQFPLDATIALGDSVTSFGRVFVPGLTDVSAGIDPLATLVAEAGIGATGTDPTSDPSWTWTTGTANPGWDDFAAADFGVDEYQTDVLPAVRGSYDTAYRFSLDAGATWAVCDAEPEGSTNGFETPGSLEVLELCTDLGNPVPECGAGEDCTPIPNTPLGDVAACGPAPGSGTQGSGCSGQFDCAGGFACVTSIFQCLQYCEVGGAACPGFGPCISFGTPVFVEGTEWGVCF